MVAIITGDIVNSQLVPPQGWLNELKTVLSQWGKSPKDWELYRGDGFQVKIKNPVLAMEAAVKLKAAIRSIDPLDVRMAIGVGEEEYMADRLMESNGPAYVRSGEGFENLEDKKQHLFINTPWHDFNLEINLMLKLALTFMDQWTAHSAKMINLALHHPEKTQKALGMMEGISQHAVSARLSRGNFGVTEEFLIYFQRRINTFLI